MANTGTEPVLEGPRRCRPRSPARTGGQAGPGSHAGTIRDTAGAGQSAGPCREEEAVVIENSRARAGPVRRARSTAASSPRSSPRTARHSSAVLDDGRVEELSSGRDRGAGIRVVVGETTGFAHTADLSEAGLLRAAEAASAVARGGGGGTRTVAARARDRWGPDTRPVTGLPRKVARRRDNSSCCVRADEAARSSGDAITQVQAGLRRRSPAPGADRQLGRPAGRRRPGRAPASRCRAWPSATPACRPGTSRPPARSGFELFDEVVGGGAGPHRRPPGARPS